MGRDYPLSPTPEFDNNSFGKRKERMSARQEKLKKEYNNPTPKLEWQNKNKTQMIQKLSTDTSGLASGKKVFTERVTLRSGKETYRPVPRGYVERISKSKKS